MPGQLLTSPQDVATGDRTEVKFRRYHGPSPSAYVNQSEPFRLHGRDFQRQYFHIYSHRLQVLRARLERQLAQSHPEASVISLSELSAHKQREVTLIGTLYKHQELKPNILQDLSEDNALLPQPSRTKYISPEDDLILEDNLQRIRLRGDKINVAQLVTGVVCAVWGTERESGKLDVKAMVFPSGAPAIPRPIPEQDSYIVFVSGLELADPQGASLAAFQMAVDWIIGEAGEMDEQKENAQIQRVILVGNSLDESTKDRAEMAKAKYLTKDVAASSIDAIKQLDDYLVQLAGSVDVDLMPGAFDPANQTLPQQPLHKCLFPSANVYSTLHCVTNPYQFELEGTECLGLSGQITDDIIRNSELDSQLDAMERLLRWSHLAPTAPDTLGCFPYAKNDPFILEKSPHLMFSGNQSQYESRVVDVNGSPVHLLSIPRFKTSHSVVAMNLKSLSFEEIHFDASLTCPWLK